MQAHVPLEEQYARLSRFVAQLKSMPIAQATEKANEQHYEVRSWRPAHDALHLSHR